MRATTVIAVAAALGVVAAGTAVYLYESGQPIAITLTPSTTADHTTIVPLPRKVGQKVTLTLPPGGTWAAVGATGSTSLLAAGGSVPVTYTMNATDTAINATWLLNGTPYVNVFQIT